MNDWLTFKELDSRVGLAKGSAFRAFKALESELDEGRDFRVLDSQRDAAELAALRAADRVYRSSVKVVVLSPTLARRIEERLRAR